MKKCMLKNVLISFCLFAVIPAVVSGNDNKETAETTITSDQMELIDNGAQTVFTGHVVLQQSPYVMTADRMTRLRDTGIVEADGHIVGTWLKPTGEKTVAVGDRARYNPQAQTTELWKAPRLTHWDTAKDPTPMVATAERFIAHHDSQMLFGKKNVVIRRGTDFESRSDEAQFDQTAQVIHLWGKRRTELAWNDTQGSGRFFSDRALLYLSPRRARLMDHVTGHVIPAPR